VKIIPSANPNQEAADLLQEALLRHPNALLLLSGGSASRVYELVSPANLPPTLVVGLVDERFGTPDHESSNLNGIKKSGIITALEAARVTFQPILHGQSRQQEVESYEQWLNKHYDRPWILILGIGPDGHTAGMLPDTDAARFHATFSAGLVAGYDNTGPYPSRITLTIPALQHATEVIVIAADKSKRPVIDRLASDQQIAENEMPAVVLRALPNVSIFVSQ
jgi:6-phosphogluconolactonase